MAKHLMNRRGRAAGPCDCGPHASARPPSPSRLQATPRLPVYRTATLLVVSNAGGTCRSGRNAQVVITKAVWMHCHSEPSTALSIDFGRVMAIAPPASAAITNVIASTFTLSGKKVMAVAYLGSTVDKEISAASGNFFDVFFNHMMALNNYLALSSRDAPEFLGEVPSFIRTNGNPDVDAAMRWLIADTADDGCYPARPSISHHLLAKAQRAQ